MIPLVKTKGIIISMGLLLCFSAEAAITFTDNFDDGVKDSFWNVPTEGSGATIAETDGQLVISIAADASGSPISAAYQSAGLFTGDFDEQVEFSLLDWQPESGVRIGIGLSLVAAMERVSFGVEDVGKGDLYVTDFHDGFFAIPASGTTGRLRLANVDGMLSGYYLNGNEWALIHTGPCLPGEAKLSVAMWTGEPVFGYKTATVAFDNFRVTYDETTPAGVVPEPSTVFAGFAMLLPFALCGLRRLW